MRHFMMILSCLAVSLLGAQVAHAQTRDVTFEVSVKLTKMPTEAKSFIVGCTVCEVSGCPPGPSYRRGNSVQHDIGTPGDPHSFNGSVFVAVKATPKVTDPKAEVRLSSYVCNLGLSTVTVADAATLGLNSGALVCAFGPQGVTSRTGGPYTPPGSPSADDQLFWWCQSQPNTPYVGELRGDFPLPTAVPPVAVPLTPTPGIKNPGITIKKK